MMKNKKGFTLIELIVVITIIGIITLFATPTLIGYLNKAQLARIQHDVKVAENIAEEKLAINSEFPVEWENVDFDKLTQLSTESKLYDTKGLVVDEEIEDGNYVKLSKNSINTKLKGDFYANQGGKVYYVSADNIKKPKVTLKTMKIMFEENKSKDQSKVINIPNVKTVNIKTVNDGSADVEISEDGKVTVNVTNGSGKTVQTGGIFTPAESKKVNDHNSPTYNVDGFTGTLEKYVHSGVFTPAESKEVTNQSSPTYNVDGFTGTLEKYVHSGVFSPAESKKVTDHNAPTYNVGGFKGTLEKYVHSGIFTPAVSKEITGHNSSTYNIDGFTGNLTRYLSSGSHSPAASKEITDHNSPTYNSEGFTGTLTKYLSSGSHSPAESKEITGHNSPTYNSGGFTGTLTKYLYSGSYTQGESKYVTINKTTRARVCFMFNSNGRWTTVECTNKDPVVESKITYTKDSYSGELNYIGSNPSTMCKINPPTRPGKPQEVVELMFDDCMDSEYGGQVTKPAVDTRVYKYRGLATKPEVDTRVYKYKGTVTKPETDTRVYKYKGTVTKPEVDTRVYKYKGTVTKPEVDTRVYKYKGAVTKPEVDTRVYKYKGLVTKPELDTRVYETHYGYEVEIEYTIEN